MRLLMKNAHSSRNTYETKTHNIPWGAVAVSVSARQPDMIDSSEFILFFYFGWQRVSENKDISCCMCVCVTCAGREMIVCRPGAGFAVNVKIGTGNLTPVPCCGECVSCHPDH